MGQQPAEPTQGVALPGAGAVVVAHEGDRAQGAEGDHIPSVARALDEPEEDYRGPNIQAVPVDFDLLQIDFSAEWESWIAPSLLGGMRVIGVLDFRLYAELRKGVLCKLQEVNQHCIVDARGVMKEQPAQADIDHFLMLVRRGKGGRGRGQGRAAADGVCYPKRVEFLLAQQTIQDLLALDAEGEGLSACVRKLLGEVDVTSVKTIEDPGPAVTPHKTKIYLDPSSLTILKELGGGNNARGLRRLWASLSKTNNTLIRKDQPVRYDLDYDA